MLHAFAVYCSIIFFQLVPSMYSKPFSVAVYAGANVTLPCHNDSSIIHFHAADWIVYSPGSTVETEICLNGICVDGFSRRFSVNMEDNFKLAILSVVVNDSGSYVCVAFDDFTEYRHTVELNISERLISGIHGNDSTAVASSKVVLIVVCLTTGIVIGACSITIFVVCRLRNSRTCRKNDPTTSELQTYTISPTRFTTTHNRWDCDIKVVCEQIETETISLISFDSGVDYEHSTHLRTVENLVLVNDERLLVWSFVQLFREFYNGSNASASAATTFQLLASSSKLWWKALQEKSTDKRIRCLLYYECSGYGMLPTRIPHSVHPASAISSVVAVAVMNERVYTICKESDTIYFDSGHMGSIQVKGMKFPVDIVASASAEVLYVADEQRCIWRVSSVGGPTEKLKEFRERVPRALSINWHGSLLVTTDSNVIMKMARNGSSGRDIYLDENTEVLHAVETSHHTAVICCRRGTRGCIVAEVGFNGQEIHRFICAAQLMRTPSYIALDRDGRLLVADTSTSRILLLDSKLKHSYTILDHRRHGIGVPQRLCLEELTGKLFVTEWGGHSVQIFNVKVPSMTSNKLN